MCVRVCVGHVLVDARYRAPEVMLGIQWDHKVDVWSFGCTAMELIRGTPLFQSPTVEGVLASHQAVCGPMPLHMLRSKPDLARMFFTSDGASYWLDPPNMPEGAYLLSPRSQASARVPSSAVPGHTHDLMAHARAHSTTVCLLSEREEKS